MWDFYRFQSGNPAVHGNHSLYSNEGKGTRGLAGHHRLSAPLLTVITGPVLRF